MPRIIYFGPGNSRSDAIRLATIIATKQLPGNRAPAESGKWTDASGLARGIKGRDEPLAINVAEQNALLQASLHGVSVKDSTLYCTNQPCIICAKMIINAGIKEIVISEGYPDKMSMDFFKQAGVTVRFCNKKKVTTTQRHHVSV